MEDGGHITESNALSLQTACVTVGSVLIAAARTVLYSCACPLMTVFLLMRSKFAMATILSLAIWMWTHSGMQYSIPASHVFSRTAPRVPQVINLSLRQKSRGIVRGRRSDMIT